VDVEQFLILFLTIAAGAAGYLIVTFWVQPILKYREIKRRVREDLVFFGNARDLYKQGGEIRQDTMTRMKQNRRSASELGAIYSDLPWWYRRWLRCRKENPREAVKELIGLSNSTDWRDAEDYERSVKKYLRF
jgi:hypothetical protein